MQESPIRVGPFELLKPIAQGGTATVWKARHRSSQLSVALKILALTGSARLQVEVQNEIRALAGLQHPHIVMLIDAGEVSEEDEKAAGDTLRAGSPWLAMEYIEGGSLSKLKKSLSWFDLRRILLAVLDALAYAHSRGVIHLDLKPANVLFGGREGEMVLKLSDFGLAYVLRHSMRSASLPPQLSMVDMRDLTPTVAGTPHYMAPEQFEAAHRDYGPWTDLYGLGCLAYKLATGSPPFSYESWLQINLAHHTQAVPPLTTLHRLPDGFEAWLLKLLEKDPAARFQRAADAAAALLALEDPWKSGGLPPPLDATLETAMAGDVDSTHLLEDDVSDDMEFLSGWSQTLTSLHNVAPREATAPRERACPPLPAQWERPDPSLLPWQLPGLGLSLLSYRTLPLVGRIAERNALWSALREVHQAGRAKLVLLHGPAGTGKSRLVEWIAERAHEVGGATVLRAVHSPEGGKGDGLPRMLARHLRTLLFNRKEATERTARQLRAMGARDPHEWEGLIEVMAPALEGERPAVEDIDLDESISSMATISVQRYVALRRLLERMAKERPVIVWLDDVQWGSDALAFADHVMRTQGISPASILFLLTVQEEALARRPIEQAQLDEMFQLDGTDRLHVPPLSLEEQRVLLQQHLGLELELTMQVARRSGGNPLYSLQLVGDWAQRGLLKVGEHGLTLRDKSALAIPDTLYQVWSARIDRLLQGLPPDAGPALEVAALLGREVDNAEWSAVCAIEGLRIPETLQEKLLGNRLIQTTAWRGLGSDDSLGRWAFLHPIFRETLERLAREAGRWEVHHQACAAMIEQRYPTRSAEISARLVRHYLAAKALEPALAPLLVAANAYLASGEFRLAHGLVNQREGALAELKLPEEDPRWGEGWLCRATLYQFQGRLDAALLVARQLEFAGERHGWSPLLPTTRRRIAECHAKRGELTEATTLYQRALTGSRAQGDLAGQAWCLRGLAACARELGEPARADRYLREALELGHKQADPVGMAETLSALARLTLDQGDRQAAATWARSALTLFERAGFRTGQANALGILGAVALESNQLEQATELFQRALDLDERIGDLYGVANALNNLAEVDRRQGRLDAAAEKYRRSIEVHTTIHSGQGIFPRFNLALLLLARRDFEGARSWLEPCRRDLGLLGRRFLTRLLHLYLLPCAAGMRDWALWDVCMERIGSISDHRSVDRDDAWAVELAGDVANEAGELERAQLAWALAITLWRAQHRDDRAAALAARIRQSGGGGGGEHPGGGGGGEQPAA